MLRSVWKYFILSYFLLLFSYCTTPVYNFDKEIDALIAQMTLEEKVALLHGNTMFTNAGCERLGIPGLHLSDGPHGVREEISLTSFKSAGWTTDSATYFPTGTAVAATWNPKLAYVQGEALGAESRARKKDIILGPGVNIHRSPLCGRNFEYLSEDPLLTSIIAVDYIKGIQNKNVAACIKHYVANNQELDRSDVDVYMSERALREIYLPAYKEAVQKANVMTFMGAYNKFRGDWCCESKYLLTDILRDEWGFKGLVMSDWSAVHSTVKAANAGLDLEMGTRKPFNEFYFADPLIEAVNNGAVSMEVIDQKVRNILWVAFSTKVIGDTATRAKGEFVTPAHLKIAYNVAKESIVLLKNERNVLPVDATRIKTIAVFGDNATRQHAEGGFSSGIKAKYEITPLEGLKNRLGNKIEIRYSLGYEKTTDHMFGRGTRFLEPQYSKDSLIAEAVKIAASSDIAIIFGGLNHDFDTEGYDKLDIDLPYAQVDLINEIVKVNPNTIVVITAGSPVDFRGFASNVPAILWGWYNGMEGGNALADVILGEVNPSGKMPFTLPQFLEQSSPHALGAYHGKDSLLTYKEDILVGYRWFDTKNIEPMFPFGHGLSYTRFEILNQTINTSKEKTIIKVDIKNAGKIAGAETVQLYVSAPGIEALRPTRELKAFEKVFLAPGEQKKITFEIPHSNLAWYDENNSTWRVENGEYTFYVGNSSRELPVKQITKINIK